MKLFHQRQKPVFVGFHWIEQPLLKKNHFHFSIYQYIWISHCVLKIQRLIFTNLMIELLCSLSFLTSADDKRKIDFPKNVRFSHQTSPKWPKTLSGFSILFLTHIYATVVVFKWIYRIGTVMLWITGEKNCSSQLIPYRLRTFHIKISKGS